jgi:nucleotide-binding universal stress UspA family protein
VRPLVREGEPVTVLRGLAAENDVAMLVVGKRGHGTALELILGSVSHGLLHRPGKPLVIVPPLPDNPAVSPTPRIVVGVDGSTNAAAALEWAAQEALLHHATVDAVMAWSVSPFEHPRFQALTPGGRADIEAAAAEALDRAVAGLDTQAPVERNLIRGRAASVLVKRAASAELLVVGSRGLGMAKEILLGSTSQACAHHATVPVVIVPTP